MLQLFPQGQEDPLKDCTPWSTFSAPNSVNKFPVKPLQLYKVNSILWSFDVIKRFGLLPRGGSIQSKASLFIWGYGLSGHQNIEAKYRGISMDYGTTAIWHMHLKKKLIKSSVRLLFFDIFVFFTVGRESKLIVRGAGKRMMSEAPMCFVWLRAATASCHWTFCHKTTSTYQDWPTWKFCDSHFKMRSLFLTVGRMMVRRQLSGQIVFNHLFRLILHR